MKSQELRLGCHVKTRDPHSGEEYQGRVISLREYPVDGISLRLDDGRKLFIQRRGLQKWTFDRI